MTLLLVGKLCMPDMLPGEGLQCKTMCNFTPNWVAADLPLILV